MTLPACLEVGLQEQLLAPASQGTTAMDDMNEMWIFEQMFAGGITGRVSCECENCGTSWEHDADQDDSESSGQAAAERPAPMGNPQMHGTRSIRWLMPPSAKFRRARDSKMSKASSFPPVHHR